ncbi:MAG: protein-L-isoaspartate(D-aspartate) O-methyltransferase [Campylobacter sp.]|uniref:protein-L-isoaspartate(D-aspartate) O-methyltransferase n=1 Tax=Campylobacter sp. TaxID=205 RepID=UPI002AA66056|nr:protein-L-isoaspartate(D-aspartate) O-methyltransferase [Campylobacter sp.]MCI7246372.1 protein-L-isoaspartate(D-aspartate) O-methyltransferase [Campylobacter sp.]
MDHIESIKCLRLAEQIAGIINISKSVFDAIAATPRSAFVPSIKDAFSLDPQSIGGAQWISSPLTVAKMTEALRADGCDNVLEIGCGSGYQAAVLSKIAHRVFSIERIESLASSAKARLKQLGFNNVFVRFDDGSIGWKSSAPFDRIILSCATASVPQALFDQLKEDGVLVAPVAKDGTQQITRYIKTAAGIEKEVLDSCDFVPLLSGRA